MVETAKVAVWKPSVGVDVYIGGETWPGVCTEGGQSTRSVLVDACTCGSRRIAAVCLKIVLLYLVSYSSHRHYYNKPSAPPFPQTPDLERRDASSELGSHVSEAGLHALGSTLVLDGSAEKVLHALLHGSPGQVLEGLWGRLLLHLALLLRLLDALGCLEQLAADLVCHSHELAELERSAFLAGKSELLGDLGCLADGLCVVAGDEQVDVGEFALHARVLLSQDVLGNAVIAGVGVLLGVVDALPDVTFNVCSTDELDTNAPVFLLSLTEVVGKSVRAGLEVCLVGVVDDGLSVAVVLSHQVSGPLVDGALEGGLLGVNHDAAVLGSGLLAELFHGVGELLGRVGTGGKSITNLRSSTSESAFDIRQCSSA